MRVEKIVIQNFRLLKNFSISLEKNLSLVLGKNNSGKTSLLSVMDKFFNASERNKICFDDLNVELKEKLAKIVGGLEAVVCREDYIPLGITMKVYLEYEDEDDLSQVGALIMNLDPMDRNIVLGYEYVISHEQLSAMRDDFEIQKDKYDDSAVLFLSENHGRFFGPIARKSLLSSDFSVFADLSKEKISLDEVISFKFISAKRSVTNKNNDKTLSGQTATIYKKTEESAEQQDAVEGFKKKLRDTDVQLTQIYQQMFSKLLGKVERFGGLSNTDTSIKIASTLQHREILDGNTTVMYRHENHDLPEHFNGLGYMNLISMIFELELLMTSFRCALFERPAAINILFIEEPEAHTHPQMQYVFIKNIKSLLSDGRKRQDGVILNLQTIISTHSSHIVAESDFDDIKYLKRAADNIDAKSLKSLKKDYENDSCDPKGATHFRFLKQYLYLYRGWLFFSVKPIVVEGETERVLLPAIMRKLDQENIDPEVPPLISQNISIVEVGAHSQIFEKFINFIGVKTLILTDIDTGRTEISYGEDGITPKTFKNGNVVTSTKKCPPNDPAVDHFSNGALAFYYSKPRAEIAYLLGLELKDKIMSKIDGKWKASEFGHVLVSFQTKQEGYTGRSFEDSFFHINKDFFKGDYFRFPSLVEKWLSGFCEDRYSAFELAENGISKKTSLAIEILLNSKPDDTCDFSNWKTPAYIEEGLQWLRK